MRIFTHAATVVRDNDLMMAEEIYARWAQTFSEIVIEVQNITHWRRNTQ